MKSNENINEKKKFAAVECEVIFFSARDVVTASGAFETQEDVFDHPFHSNE